MKLWLSKSSEIPLREQLTRQIMFAISSEELQSGEKLPSVRELAIRFKVHQNTVSKAYQWLEENGWVESRQGSGVFVRNLEKVKVETAKSQNQTELDLLITQFFRKLQQLSYSNSQIKTGIQKVLDNPKLNRILIVEDDEFLQRIIFTELNSIINFPMFVVSPQQLANAEVMANSIIIAIPKHAERLAEELPKTTTIFPLKINSVQSELKAEYKPQRDQLIGIVSGWDRFVFWSKTFLIATGIDAENILTRDTREKNFRKGLESCLFVISDSATAQILPKNLDVRTFQLVANDSIEELKALVS